MSRKSLVAEIIELILNWKLKDASDRMDQNFTTFTSTDLQKLRTLLDQYRGYQTDFSEAVARLESDPEKSEFILNQIPESVRVTHPEYEVLIRNIQAFRDRASLKKAEEAMDAAINYIRIEFNPTLAEEAVNRAKRVYPNWDRVSSLRMKIHSTMELIRKFSTGLSIQKEVSALREKGGLASYQKAMRLINDYAALGLEKFDIVLFNAEGEREDLLKMITRAEGESWTHRLNGGEEDQEEILKLEQSIRSLEDAETKNIRVLYNNNARLMNLLLAEVGTLDLSSERAIQADKRIGELREKNQKLKEEAVADVANRGEEYYELAVKAFNAGEFAIAETNLRLALETGRSESTYAEGEYLGNIELPAETVAKIQSLTERLAVATAERGKIGTRLEEIRTAFNSEKYDSTATLERWNEELDEMMKRDRATPGLKSFRDELYEKVQQLRSFSFDFEVEKILRAMEEGETDRAADLLAVFDDYRQILSNENREKIAVLESRLKTQIAVADSVQDDVDRAEKLFNDCVAMLQVDDGQLNQYRALRREIETRYDEKHLPMALSLTRSLADREALLMLLRENGDTLQRAKKAIADGKIASEDLVALNKLSSSALAELPTFKSFQKKANRLTLREEIREPSDGLPADEAVPGVTGMMKDNGPVEIKTRTQRIFEVLYAFDGRESYSEALDFIENNLTDAEKADPAIKFEIDRIVQANRIAQAKFYFNQAQEAFDNYRYQDAEDFATLSLDAFNTVYAAQLLSTIHNRKNAQERSLKEIDAFLKLDLDGSKPLSESDAEVVRAIGERLDRFEDRYAFDSDGQARIRSAETRVERLRNQESLDFANLMRRFETWLLTGEEGLDSAEEVLNEVEKRTWIRNRSQEIFEAKLRVDDVRNTTQALDILVSQSSRFIKIGDFRSAERILNSFNTENTAKWPDWLCIRHDNAVLKIEEQKKKYQVILDQFGKDENGVAPIVNAVAETLGAEQPDGDNVARLVNQLGQMKNILDKEIEADPELNPYPKQCNYLLETVRWLDFVIDTTGTGNGNGKVVDLGADQLFSVRRMGRELLERLPVSLSALQVPISDRLKWLEQRTQVAQSIAAIRESRKRRGAKGEGAGISVDSELAELAKYELTEREEKVVQSLRTEQSRRKRTRIVLAAIPVLIVMVLASLYYASPKLIQMLTPTATATATATMTMTPLPTGTMTMTPTITPTATMTMTPTMTMTMTPMPTKAGLTGRIEFKRTGVYELPNGNRLMISDDYLPVGTTVEILRYCQPSYDKNDYWALIRYESETRNTGWIRVYTKGAMTNYVSVDPFDLMADEALELNKEYLVNCPLDPNEAMPEEPPL